MTPKGLYCPKGDFYIDPWRPVHTAVITHAHSDHARSGHTQYIAASSSEQLLRKRLGADIRFTGLAYQEPITLGEVECSLHPAGHILGSSQIKIMSQGEIWVVTGDYKRQTDPTCAAFEPISCDVLITEATFALPIYRWLQTEEVVSEIYRWWMKERAKGRNAILACYSLGKAQRILAELKAFTEEPIYVHGAVDTLTTIYRDLGVSMVPTLKVGQEKLKGALVLAPPAALEGPWSKRLADASVGFASGWMSLRGVKRRKGYDQGFVISDHADWPGLLQTIEQSDAKKILVTHGYCDEFSRYLNEKGANAEPIRTLFEGEGDS